MVNMIFGRSGYGKTHYIMNELKKCVDDGIPSFLIVPEQSAVSTERLVIETLGSRSNLYIEVINFKRLCNRVFRETGGLASKHIDSGEKKLIMANALCDIEESLSEYKSSARNADFVGKAISSVNELHVCGITSQQISDVCEVLSTSKESADTANKLRDLSLISDAFGALMTQVCGESSDIYEKLCEKLQDSAFFSGKRVFFDSFYGFTAQELKIISYIIEDADDVYITFDCDKDSSDDIFTRSRDSAASIRRLCDNANAAINEVVLTENRRHKSGGALYVFEAGFNSDILALATQSDKAAQGINIIHCRDIYAEVKAALSTVCALVRNGSLYSDICIAAKNPSDYDGIIGELFAAADVPFGTDRVHRLSDSALSALITSAFEAALTRSQSSVLRYIKTGLSGLTDEQADIFETYVRTWNISGKLFRKDDDWQMNPDGYVEGEPDALVLQAVNSARSLIFTCLESLEDNLKSDVTLRGKAKAVWQLLSDIAHQSGKESFDDGDGGESLNLLCDCLDGMVNVSGDRSVSPTEFSRLFKLCADEYDMGHIPESCDEVSFSTVDLMRASNVKHVILLGANDGIFPSRTNSTGLFSDSEKQLLCDNGLKLRDSVESLAYDELFLAYCSICSASESVYIMYSEATVDGVQQYPSVIIRAVKALCGVGETIYRADDFSQNFAGNKALFDELITLQDGSTRRTLEAYFSTIPEYRARLDALNSGVYDGGKLSEDSLHNIFGDKIYTSYSRLEKFNECPFSHFCTYTLRLKPEPSAKLGPPEAGLIMHKILEEFVPQLAKSRGDGKLMTEEQASALIRQLLAQHLKGINAIDKDASSKRFEYLYNRLSRLLCALAANLVREMQVSKFTPCDFELSISDKSDVSPVPIDLGDGRTLYITGQIDRVDKFESDGKTYIRIIDYKTGTKEFNKDDILAGFNLQMLLYMYSICRSGKKKYGKEVTPAGVLYENVTSPDKNAELESGNVEYSVGNAVISGVLINDKDILYAMDPYGNKEFIPIKLSAVGTDKDTCTVTPEKMLELLDFAAETARQLTLEMCSGEKTAKPFINKKIDACRFCDMLFVCQGFGQSRYKRNTEFTF